MRGFWLVASLLPGALAAEGASSSDIRRAKTKVPGSAYRGPSAAGLDSILNKHLSKLPAATASCASFSHADLKDAVQRIGLLRSSPLMDIYRLTSDARGAQEDVLVQDIANIEPNLATIVRDTLCRQAVLSYVHHLTDEGRAQVAKDGLVLPELPGSAHPSPANPTAKAQAIYKQYQVVSACQDCHYSGSKDSTGASPKQAAGPAPAPAWASNVNYSIYAGFGDCCSTSSNWTQHRVIDRRFDLNPPQQLETTAYCDDGKHDGSCCILDQCKNDDNSALRQYDDCVIFYNGTTIWEWYRSLGKCSKLVEGAGEVTNTWFTDSHSGDYGATDQVNEVPDITKNRTCIRYPSSGPPLGSVFPPSPTPGGLPSAYWAYPDGKPCKHHFGRPGGGSGGVDNYHGYVETPELKGKPIMDKLPDFCPPADSKPALPFPQYMGDQSWVCTRCWLLGTCPTSVSNVIV